MSVRYLEHQVKKGIVCHRSHAAKSHSIFSIPVSRKPIEFSGYYLLHPGQVMNQTAGAQNYRVLPSRVSQNRVLPLLPFKQKRKKSGPEYRGPE